MTDMAFDKTKRSIKLPLILGDAQTYLIMPNAWFVSTIRFSLHILPLPSFTTHVAKAKNYTAAAALSFKDAANMLKNVEPSGVVPNNV